MEYELRVSSRARRLRIEVPFGGPPLLVVPRGVSRARAERFLAERRPWVEEQLARHVPRLALPPLTERQGRARARALATGLCEREAPLLGVRYERIRIADQRSRWGSCSSRGTLSFNWRLVLAPPAVLDYVPNTPREAPEATVGVSNSFGFGGHNASIVVRRWDEP